MALPGNRSIEDYVSDIGEKLDSLSKKIAFYRGDFPDLGSTARTALKIQMINKLAEHKTALDAVITEINAIP